MDNFATIIISIAGLLTLASGLSLWLCCGRRKQYSLEKQEKKNKGELSDIEDGRFTCKCITCCAATKNDAKYEPTLTTNAQLTSSVEPAFHNMDNKTSFHRRSDDSDGKNIGWVPYLLSFIPCPIQHKTYNKEEESETETESYAAEVKQYDAVRSVRGLRNLGNTCYFNSTMQILLHSHFMFPAKLEKLHIKGEFIIEVLDFFRVMQSDSSDPYLPYDLHRLFGQRSPRFANHRQHDSHECLRNFLDNIRTEERENSGAVDKRKVLTVVDSVFGGHFITVYICKECGTPYHVFEALLDISLPIMIDEEDLAAMNSARMKPVEPQTQRSKGKNQPSHLDQSDIVKLTTSRMESDCKSTAMQNGGQKSHKTEQDTKLDVTLQQTPTDKTLQEESKTEFTENQTTQPMATDCKIDVNLEPDTSSGTYSVNDDIECDKESLTATDLLKISKVSESGENHSTETFSSKVSDVNVDNSCSNAEVHGNLPELSENELDQEQHGIDEQDHLQQSNDTERGHKQYNADDQDDGQRSRDTKIGQEQLEIEVIRCVLNTEQDQQEDIVREEQKEHFKNSELDDNHRKALDQIGEQLDNTEEQPDKLDIRNNEPKGQMEEENLEQLGQVADEPRHPDEAGKGHEKVQAHAYERDDVAQTLRKDYNVDHQRENEYNEAGDEKEEGSAVDDKAEIGLVEEKMAEYKSKAVEEQTNVKQHEYVKQTQESDNGEKVKDEVKQQVEQEQENDCVILETELAATVTKEEENDDDDEEDEEVQKQEDDNDHYRKAIDRLMTPLSLSSQSLPNNERATKKHVTVHDCLSYFTRIENITKEYLCNDCYARNPPNEGEDPLLTSATKQTLIFNPPAILTLHLKRFELKEGGSVKRNDIITYEELLDIAPYCSSMCLRNDPPCQNIWYSLYGVVVHHGSTLNFGHYTAYIKIGESKNDADFGKLLQKNFFDRDVTRERLIDMMQRKQSDMARRLTCEQPTGTWYCMNDSSCREVSVRTVLNQEAYLLFYERMS